MACSFGNSFSASNSRLSRLSRIARRLDFGRSGLARGAARTTRDRRITGCFPPGSSRDCRVTCRSPSGQKVSAARGAGRRHFRRRCFGAQASRSTTPQPLGCECFSTYKGRMGWDSNPRYAPDHTVIQTLPSATGPRARLPNGVHFHPAWQGCSGFVSYPKNGPKRQFSYTVQQISIPQAIVIAQLSTYF